VNARLSFFAELQRRHVYKVGAMYCVAGWLLVQIVTQVLPVFDVSALGQRILVLVVVAGFPVALVLAWLFDLTPQGIVRTGELPVSGETPAAAHERRGMDRKLNYVLGALLILALGYLVLERTLLRGGSIAVVASEKSIAVLPLVNNSGDPANEYFSDGLSEEMISILAKIPDLKLIGRASSFRFKHSGEDSKAIGEKLGVANLLEGSVSREGERVRIVAELVSAADGRELWSETYDRELKDVFAVQTEIATAVAEQMKLKLLGAAAGSDAATVIPAAHNALLHGDAFYQQFSEAGMRQAIGAYQEAIRLDPQYALAYAKLSLAWRQLAVTWLTGEEAQRAGDEARQAAQTALRLEPGLARAHQARGFELLTVDFDLPGAEVELGRAAELAPSDAETTVSLAYLYAAQGRLAEAEALSRKAVTLDPLFLPPYHNLARVLFAQRRDDEAVANLRKAAELQPQASRHYAYLALIDVVHGDAKAALEHAAQEPEGFWRDYAVALAQQAQGDTAAADRGLQQFITQWGVGAPFQVALIYSVRKDANHTFEWLDRAYRERDSGMTQLMVNPTLLVWRNDPRFAAICAKLKILPPGTAQ
jgi:serine/threonine-protein kinase